MRIDKFVSNLGYGSRKQVAFAIKDGSIGINGKTVNDSGMRIQFGDTISIGTQSIVYQSEVSILLHKPAGYVSSDKSEAGYPSYQELLGDCPYRALVHIVGRLDVDTTGLLVLTTNGALTHEIIHPKKAIWKRYLVHFTQPLTQKDQERLEKGVKIDDHVTLPARYIPIDANSGHIGICEGRFHQIKKMFEALGNQVTSLHRESIGGLELGDLACGAWRYLDQEDLKALKHSD